MIGKILLFNTLGPWEILIIVGAILLFFGGRKIPQLARDMGLGIREFRKSLSGVSDEVQHASRLEEPEEEYTPPPRATTRTKKKVAKKSAAKKSASKKSRRA